MTAMFLVIAVVASAFLGLQMLLLIFGADMDFDSDMDVDAADGGGFMSVRSLTAFFGGFGWAGFAARQAGWGAGVSLLFAIGVGVGFFILIGFLFLQARKLTTSASLNYDTAVGAHGTVYLSIPANQSGGGKVEVEVSGRLSIVDAITEQEDPIPSKTRIKVVRSLAGNTLVVEPL